MSFTPWDQIHCDEDILKRVPAITMDSEILMVAIYLAKIKVNLSKIPKNNEQKMVTSGSYESKLLQSLALFYLKPFKSFYSFFSENSSHRQRYETSKKAYRTIYPKEFEKIKGIYGDGKYQNPEKKYTLTSLAESVSNVITPLIIEIDREEGDVKKMMESYNQAILSKKEWRKIHAKIKEEEKAIGDTFLMSKRLKTNKKIANMVEEVATRREEQERVERERKERERKEKEKEDRNAAAYIERVSKARMNNAKTLINSRSPNMNSTAKSVMRNFIGKKNGTMQATYDSASFLKGIEEVPIAPVAAVEAPVEAFKKLSREISELEEEGSLLMMLSMNNYKVEGKKKRDEDFYRGINLLLEYLKKIESFVTKYAATIQHDTIVSKGIQELKDKLYKRAAEIFYNFIFRIPVKHPDENKGMTISQIQRQFKNKMFKHNLTALRSDIRFNNPEDSIKDLLLTYKKRITNEDDIFIIGHTAETYLSISAMKLLAHGIILSKLSDITGGSEIINPVNEAIDRLLDEKRVTKERHTRGGRLTKNKKCKHRTHKRKH
jgi:hypothetical protein